METVALDRPKSACKARPMTKRKMRELEAQRTMPPEEFRRWREYRKKNNLSVQRSRQRKRQRLKEAELAKENAMLQCKVNNLEKQTDKYMGLISQNVNYVNSK